jgi:hypothetical protein
MKSESENYRDNSRLTGEKSYCQMWIALRVAGLSDIPTHTHILGSKNYALPVYSRSNMSVR